MVMRCLIDGDVIRYSAGFASDQNIYSIGGEEFDYKKDAVFYAKSHGLDVDDISLRVEAEPVEYCLSSVKKMIASIMEANNADECTIYLTGKGNFRDTIATTAPYKGNRDSSHKPIHYDAIGEYLINTWKAEVVEDIEADDAMGTLQWGMLPWEGEELNSELYNTVICTIDKDLKMIPGFNYNWRTDELLMVTEKEANNFFYRQLLTGDSVDNIIGCGKREEAVYKTGKKAGQTYMKRKGIGPKKAESLLPMHMKEEELYKEVMKQYDVMFDEDAGRALRENADLLWIRREAGVSWHPPIVD